MNEMLGHLWRLGGPLRGWLLWLVHAKFTCGVTGVARADDGRVLLLRHRFWAADMAWGFPSGCANRGERHEDTIVREVREETGLTVSVGRLLAVRSGYRNRIEVYYEVTLPAGFEGLDGLVLDRREIIEARLFPVGELPPNMPPAHRKLAAGPPDRRPGADRGAAGEPTSLPRVLAAPGAGRA